LLTEESLVSKNGLVIRGTKILMTKEEKEMAREIGARVFCNKNSVSRKICQNWGRNRGRGDGGEKKEKKEEAVEGHVESGDQNSLFPS
jgi:hypothetical protein